MSLPFLPMVCPFLPHGLKHVLLPVMKAARTSCSLGMQTHRPYSALSWQRSNRAGSKFGTPVPKPTSHLPTSKITKSYGQPQGLGQQLGPNSAPPATPGAAALGATGASRRYRATFAPWEAPGLAGQQSWEEPGVYCWHSRMQATGFQLVQGRAPAGRGQGVLLPRSLNQHFISCWRPFSEVKHLQKGMGLICRGGPAVMWGQWHHPPAYQTQDRMGVSRPMSRRQQDV